MFKFSDLQFRNHLHLSIPIEQAKYNGHSIIRGRGIRGIEIMVAGTGDVHSGLTEQQIENFINTGKF